MTRTYVPLLGFLWVRGGLYRASFVASCARSRDGAIADSGAPFDRSLAQACIVVGGLAR
jgi:hypothetical protein